VELGDYETACACLCTPDLPGCLSFGCGLDVARLLLAALWSRDPPGLVVIVLMIYGPSLLSSRKRHGSMEHKKTFDVFGQC
jgi:hypothetical protein